jgi:hypothetical protein
VAIPGTGLTLGFPSGFNVPTDPLVVPKSPRPGFLSVGYLRRSARRGQQISGKIARAMRAPLRHGLALSAAGSWLLLFASIAVAPMNYGILNETIPPEPVAAVRFYVAQLLFHLAHAFQVVIAVAALTLILLRRTRSWSSGIAFVVSSAFVTFGLAFGTFPNIGLPFGYYGKFNRIQGVLNACSAIKVIDSWQHRDLSLEDFGFTIQEPSGKPLELEFDGALAFAELE